MKRFTLIALLPLLFAPLACAQSAASDTERAERIVANLKHEFPQLENTTIVVNEIRASGMAGVERGSFTINGQQTQEFLIAADDTQLYLIITDPIDASRDAAALAAAISEREQGEAQAAQARAAEMIETFGHLPVRGNPNAPVTIVEFSDFQCPFCARAHETVEQLLANNPDTIRLIYVQYPLPNHQWARPASLASLCAAQQDDAAFWVLHDGYFENQRSMTPANVLDRSREWLAGTGVDLNTWNTCVQDADAASHQQAQAEIERGMAVASDHGVSGTPAFFINGRFLNGAQPLEVFQAVVDEAAAGS